MDKFLPQERTYPAMKSHKPNTVGSWSETIPPAALFGSFDDLFLEHWGSIYRLLERMTGDPSEAEDLALETFFKLYQHPPKTGEGYNLGGWLYRVATNLGLRSIRSLNRRKQYEMEAGKEYMEDLPENKPAEILEKKEDHLQARSALAKMNPRNADLLVLRYSGMSYKDIAKAMRLSPTSIGPLLLRAEHEFEKAYRTLSQEEP
jgi:RNA polymerase sigma factor (sigma-70 family)